MQDGHVLHEVVQLARGNGLAGNAHDEGLAPVGMDVRCHRAEPGHEGVGKDEIHHRCPGLCRSHRAYTASHGQADGAGQGSRARRRWHGEPAGAAAPASAKGRGHARRRRGWRRIAWPVRAWCRGALLALGGGMALAPPAWATPEPAATASAAAASAASAAASAGPTAPRLMRAPRAEGRLQASQLGLVINQNDPYSVAVGAWYQARRGLKPAQVLRVRLPVQPQLAADALLALRQQAERAFGPQIQAVALAWRQPYAVACQSVTAAFSLGLQPGLCENTCGKGRESPYFNSASARPWQLARCAAVHAAGCTRRGPGPGADRPRPGGRWPAGPAVQPAGTSGLCADRGLRRAMCVRPGTHRRPSVPTAACACCRPMSPAWPG